MACFGLMALGAALPGQPALEAAEPGLHYTRFTLENGLTVILRENHASPVVAFNAWVQVGSGDEADEESGLAHVLEHMVFKGTERRQVGQIAQEVEGAGGDINAFTSFDQTVYHIVLASRFFDTGLDIMADAIRNSALDPQELTRELEVVLEEVRRGEDTPSRRVSQALFQEAYRVHPYRRPVIGTTNILRSFDRPKIVRFLKKWYVPENIVLVVVGDFQTEKAEASIRAVFGDWPAKPAPPRPRTAEPEQREMRMALLEDSVHDAYLNIAFHIPALNHEDVYALDALALVVGQGESSRLYRRVKDEAGLVHSVFSSAYTPKDPGLLVVSAVLEPEKLRTALEGILRELYALRHSPPSAAELDKAKLNIEADFVFRHETVQGQAQSLGYFETVAGNLEFERHYLEKIRALTPRDLQRAAEKYFRKEHLTVAMLLPKDKASLVDPESVRNAAEAAEASLREAGPAGAPESGPPGKPAPVRETSPPDAAPPGEIRRETLPNGLTVIVKDNPNVPTVAVRAVYLGGLLWENETTSGINNFIADLLTRGTETHGAAEFATLVDSMAASISGFSGRNSLGVTGEALSRFFDRLLGLMGEVILRPAFDSQEIEKVRLDILAEIKREEDNLSQYALKLFFRTLYGTHPYALPVNGTLESVRSFQRADLLRYYRAIATPRNLVLAIVGDVRADYAIRRVKELFGDQAAGSPPAAPSAPIAPPDGPAQEIKRREKQQAHIVLGFLGTTLNSEDRYPLEVLNAVLSGQSGRLFLELRDKQSLAYAVSSFNTEGIQPGTLGVYIATAPEKIEAALQGIRSELEKIRSVPVPRDELERAKKYIIGGYEIDLQRNSAQAADMAFNERYGLGWDEYRHYPDRIAAVAPEDVLRVARKYIRLTAPVVGMVKPEPNGPTSPPGAPNGKRP